MKHIYLDHAATTPVSKDVFDAMQPYFREKYGNPSSIYKLGQEAKSAVEHAREEVADMLGAKPREIIFTSGATESNNLALKGVAFYWSQNLKKKPHIIISSIEHHSVLDTAEYLEKNFGFEVTKLPVSKEGIVDPTDLESVIKDNTVIVSVMYGNNEVGSIQPIKELGEVIKRVNAKRVRPLQNNGKSHDFEHENSLQGSDPCSQPIVFHTDAVQAFQYLDCDVKGLGVDMLSLTGHKFYGPKGVGLLYVKSGTKFLSQQQGGAQERGLRAGTENVPYIVGMAKAMSDTRKQLTISKQQIADLRDYLVKRIAAEIPDVVLTGPEIGKKRLPHIASFIFKKIEGESILINLDLLGIAASSGSACTSGSLASSHVLTAMGYDDLLAHGSIRFSLGKMNSKEEIDEMMKHLPQIVEKLRGMSPIK